MIEILIAGVVGGIVSELITNFSFRRYIVNKSKNNKPVKVFGINYFCMTQEQIQETVKATMRSEYAIDCLKKHSEKIQKEHGWKV